MFKCDLCKKENPDTEAGVVGWLAKICWFILLAIPGVWFSPPTKVCKSCESRGNVSVWYVGGFLGFALVMFILIRLANWAYAR